MARHQTGFTVCKLWRWAIPTPWPRSPQFANYEHLYAHNTHLALCAAKTAAFHAVATERDVVKLNDRPFIRGTFSPNYAIMCHG